MSQKNFFIALLYSIWWTTMWNYSMIYYELWLTDVADEGKGISTRPIFPPWWNHPCCCAEFTVSVVIRVVITPGCEGGVATIWPLPGISVQADPGLDICRFDILNLLVLSLAPHTGQVCVVLPAVTLSFRPVHFLINVDKRHSCNSIMYIAVQINTRELVSDRLKTLEGYKICQVDLGIM